MVRLFFGKSARVLTALTLIFCLAAATDVAEARVHVRSAFRGSIRAANRLPNRAGRSSGRAAVAGTAVANNDGAGGAGSGSAGPGSAGLENDGPGSDGMYHLRLHHLHTGESIDLVYRVGSTYLPGAIERLNHFLRDHRTQDESDYDPKEFDLLHSLMTKLERPDGVIDIVCGYRTPWSNSFLRGGSASSGVAEHSQHMLAKAIDIRVPGVSTRVLRDAALSLRGGGVGYYPVSQFVHVDVGPVRTWSFRSGRD